MTPSTQVCKYIHSKRKSAKNTTRQKSITIRICDDEDNYTISARLNLLVSVNTGHISMGHSLQYRNNTISPCTNTTKLSCTNEAGNNALKHSRARVAEQSENTKYKNFNIPLGRDDDGYVLTSRISVRSRLDSDYVGIISNISYKRFNIRA